MREKEGGSKNVGGLLRRSLKHLKVTGFELQSSPKFILNFKTFKVFFVSSKLHKAF